MVYLVFQFRKKPKLRAGFLLILQMHDPSNVCSKTIENFHTVSYLSDALISRIHVYFKLNSLKHPISIQGLNILREEKLSARNVGGIYLCTLGPQTRPSLVSI